MPLPRIALFLGAGASVPHGKPTTKMFREELQDKFPSGSALHGMLNSDVLPDIEYVLQAACDILDHDEKAGGTYLRWLGEHDNIRLHGNSYREFIKSLKDDVSKLKEQFFSRYKWDGTVNPGLPLLEDVLDLLFHAGTHAHVFTTNYDTAVEKYCKDTGLKIMDGFKHDNRLQCYKWDGFSRFDHKTNDDSLYLYKLHGSLNWIETDNGIERVSMESHHVATKKFMIYPNLSTKPNARVSPYDELWSEFEEVMDGVKILIVIGYSFRDKQVADVIRKMAYKGMFLIILSPTCKLDYKNLFKSKSPLTLRLIDEKFNLNGIATIRRYVDEMTRAMHD